MEFNYVSNPKDIKRFINFNRVVYQGNPFYRDSMSDIVKMFLLNKTSYLQHGDVLPFIIEEKGKILVRAAFFIDRKLPGVLMVSFFEALPGVQAAVDLMLSRAKSLASGKGLSRIVIGLDAHLNYGVGFLASHFDDTPCFGFGYTPEYYLDYFKECREYGFTSILVELSKFNLEREALILKRLTRKGFKFRQADFRELEREIGIFTEINNACYQEHLWWSERTFQEDKELLFPFRWFIRPENLIIAEKDGRPVGLMLWYPDFNRLVPAGKGLGLGALIKNRWGGAKDIDRVKLADLVVLPEFRASGVVLGLLAEFYRSIQDRYEYCEAGWIEGNNYRSRAFGLRWQDLGCSEYKEYKAFEVVL